MTSGVGGGVGGVHCSHLTPSLPPTLPHCNHRGVDPSPLPALPQHNLLLCLLDLPPLLPLGAGHNGLRRAGALREDEPGGVQPEPSQSLPINVDDLITQSQHAGPPGPASLVNLHHFIPRTLEVDQRNPGQAHSDGLVGDPDQVDQPEVPSVCRGGVPGIKLEVVVVVVDVFLQYFPPVQRGCSGGSGESPGNSVTTAGVRALTEVVRTSSQDAGVLVI